MRRWTFPLLLLTAAACGPGLRGSLEDAGAPPSKDAGRDAGGEPDAGAEDAGAEADAGTPDGGEAGDAGSGCMDPVECPPPPDGGVALCTAGVCGFACTPPLLPCGDVCCRAVEVTAGFEHTCVLTEVGGVKCWGAWTAIGGFEDRLTPVDIPNLSGGVLALSAGYTHTCARLEGGQLRCWGLNGNGALGNGTPGPSSTPVVPVGFDAGATSLASGAFHTCAVRDGGVWCWGNNIFGELGDNSTQGRNVPGPVSGMASGVEEVFAGYSHTCALRSDGGFLCWGSNTSGQTGDGTTASRNLVPVEAVAVAQGLDAGQLAEVALGFSHSCVTLTTGHVRCFGQNAEGQAGDGTQTTPRRLSVEVVGLDGGVTLLASGSTANHTCAAKDGAVSCWGRNTEGQLGDTTVVTPRRTPVQTFGLGEVRSLAAGGAHTCAVTAEGAVKCWGLNDRGQLGDGTRTDRWAPVDVRW